MGVLKLEGAPHQLISKYLGNLREKVVVRGGHINHAIDATSRLAKRKLVGDTLFLYSEDLDAITETLRRAGVRFEIAPIVLEDVVIGMVADDA
jgi:hypothetical protein